MKITLNDGTTFEGTQAEYEAFWAFAERKVAEQEAPTSVKFAKGDSVKILGISKYGADHIGKIGVVLDEADSRGFVYVQVEGKGRYYTVGQLEIVANESETISFEGADYRKVDREAREGDVVIFHATDSCAVENDLPYLAETLVVNRKEEPTLAVRGVCNCRVYSNSFKRTRETVDVYAPIAESKPKYEPKVGDIVVVTDGGGSVNHDGDIGEVTVVDSDDTARVNVKGRSTSGNWIAFGNIRPATAEEIAQYEKAVADAEKRKSEEVKWAKLGRKVGEYKVGDIIEITRYQGGDKVGTVSKVVKIRQDDDAVDYKSEISARGAFCAGIGSFKLIAPVESVLTHN